MKPTMIAICVLGFIIGSIIYINTHKHYITVKAYCSCSICTNGKGITAYGLSSGDEGMAAQRKLRNCMVNIPEYGNMWIDDISPWASEHTDAIDRLEIRFTSHQQALNFGTRKYELIGIARDYLGRIISIQLR